MNCHFCHHTCYLSSYKSSSCTWYRDWYKCLCFLSFQSAYGQEFELSISEHQDSVEKSFIQKRESRFKGCDPTVLFITDAASYHRRSCKAALWLLPHLQLRRVLICLDVVYQAHTHEAGVSVSCSYSSDIRPSHTASLPITSWNNGTSYYGTSHPSPWWVLYCSVASSDLILFPPRIYRRAQGWISKSARCQVLWQGR